VASSREIRRQYEAKIRRRISTAERLEDKGAREVIAIVKNLSRRIRKRVQEMPQDAPWSREEADELQQGMVGFLEEFRIRYGGKLADQAEVAFRLGQGTALTPLRQVGVNVGRVVPSVRQLEILSAATADLVKGVADRVIDRINEEIQPVVIGVTSPFDAQKRIQRLIAVRDKGKFRGSMLSQAERIVRTETNRNFNVGHFDTLTQVQNTIPDMMKVWRTARDAKVRPSHRANRLQGPIRMNEKFQNGLMFPLDPAGGPEETINCRCRVVAHRASWTKGEDPGAREPENVEVRV
jgi:hypothetical protein